MATCRDLVERAYRKIGVVATDESMTADQAAVGMDALNMMMHGLVLDGIDTGYSDLELADQFSLDTGILRVDRRHNAFGRLRVAVFGQQRRGQCTA